MNKKKKNPFKIIPNHKDSLDMLNHDLNINSSSATAATSAPAGGGDSGACCEDIDDNIFAGSSNDVIEDDDLILVHDFDDSNGRLEDFDPQELMNKVKAKGHSLFTSREYNHILYDITIFFEDWFGTVSEDTKYWYDIIAEDVEGNQYEVTKYKDCRNLLDYEVVDRLNAWKHSVLNNKSSDLNEKLVYGIYTDGGDEGRREVDRVDTEERAIARVAELGDKYWFDQIDEEVLTEMAYEKSFVINKCAELGQQFINHFDKIYNETDENTIKHHGEEMQSWLDQASSYRMKYNNKTPNEKQLYDWFITVGKLPIDLFDNETEAEVYDDFANELLDTDKDVLVELNRQDLFHEPVNEDLENDLICRRDYLKHIIPGAYRDNTKEIEDANANFRSAADECDYFIVTVSKSYDPEGVSSSWATNNISYAGTKEACEKKFEEIKEHAEADRDQTVTEFNDGSFEIYYRNAISKVRYKLVKNENKVESEIVEDADGGKQNLHKVMVADYEDAPWSVEAATDGENFFFTRAELKKLNDNWGDDLSSSIIYNKGGKLFLHSELESAGIDDDSHDLEFTKEGDLFKFPCKWNWIEK